MSTAKKLTSLRAPEIEKALEIIKILLNTHTQADLARKLDCNPSYISHLIAGRLLPGKPIYQKVIKLHKSLNGHNPKPRRPRVVITFDHDQEDLAKKLNSLSMEDRRKVIELGLAEHN